MSFLPQPLAPMTINLLAWTLTTPLPQRLLGHSAPQSSLSTIQLRVRGLVRPSGHVFSSRLVGCTSPQSTPVMIKLLWAVP